MSSAFVALLPVFEFSKPALIIRRILAQAARSIKSCAVARPKFERDGERGFFVCRAGVWDEIMNSTNECTRDKRRP
jgi:hypothetical protein